MNYKSLPIQGKIIYITVAIYLATQLWRLLCLLLCYNGYDWQQMLALPANLHDLSMHPWTVFTYMFCHADIGQNFLHIVFNMLWLWWLAPIFLHYHTSKQFLSLYLTSGVFAGLFFVFVYNAFPYFLFERNYTWVVGASGAVCAMLAAIVMQPDQLVGLNLFIRTITTRMKWVALTVLVLTIVAAPAGNTGGLVCHVGGALFGFIYGYYYRKGIDITAWFSKGWEAIRQAFKGLRKPKMTATPGGRRDPISADKQRDMQYNTDKRQREARIDEILDKISKHGYDGLTAEEKQMLFDASQKRQK